MHKKKISESSEELLEGSLRVQEELESSKKKVLQEIKEEVGNLEKKTNSLKTSLLTKLEEKNDEIEEHGQAFLEEQKGIYNDIKIAAQHLEEDLKERLNVEKLLSDFEKEAKGYLSHIQEKISENSEELLKGSLKAQEELEAFKSKSLQEIEEKVLPLKEESATLETFSESIEEGQVELQTQFEKFSRLLSEEYNRAGENQEEFLSKLQLQKEEIERKSQRASPKIPGTASAKSEKSYGKTRRARN